MQAPGRPVLGDLVAGVSVALIAIPQSLAYAELAGMPARYGLFAAALPSLLAAVFVSSRYLQTGPVALTSLLTFGALSPLAEPMSADYIELAALLALMIGVLRVALGAARLGKVAYLLSPPVLVGFTTAAATLIVASQVPTVFDMDPDRGGLLTDAFHVLTHPGDWSWPAIGFSVIALISVFGGRHLHRLFPGVLAAVVIGVSASSLFGYDGSVVGDLEGGFISLGFDFRWSSTADLLLPAMVIALVGFAEAAAISRTFAAADNEPWDANREFVSQGVANLAAGISGAFPVGGSFSRSALNRLAGAQTWWAGAITGAVVLSMLPLTPLLSDLPTAVLGAIVIGAVLKLLDVRGLWDLRTQSSAHLLVGIGTLVATLLTAPRIERGVLIGIGLSIVVQRISRQRFSEPEPSPTVGR